jgi:hypothetical protein
MRSSDRIGHHHPRRTAATQDLAEALFGIRRRGRAGQDVLDGSLRVGSPSGAAHQHHAIAWFDGSAPQGDAWLLLESERARQAVFALLPRQDTLTPRKRSGVTGERYIRQIAPNRSDDRRGTDVVLRQVVSVNVPQDVVRRHSRIAYGAGLRAAVRAKVRLLHGTQQAAANLGIGQRGIDQQEQSLRPRGERPDRQLAGDDCAQRLWRGARGWHQLACHGAVVMIGGIGSIFLDACQVDAVLDRGRVGTGNGKGVRRSGQAGLDIAGQRPYRPVRRSRPSNRRTYQAA